MMLRYLTAGESHGKGIVAILEGIPAGLRLDINKINIELKRRQKGFGRGRRMKLENDRAEIISGIKNNLTLASPIALFIKNKDNSIERLHKVVCPRGGHADLAGLMKYGFSDIREVLERASARSTVATVAIGSICKIFLHEFRISIKSRVISITGETDQAMMHEAVNNAMRQKDTVGGIFELKASGVISGLGSYIHADKRLDGRIAQEIISIPGIKAVEFGLGFGYADRLGSQCHDAIYFSKKKGYFRKTNNAGGIEGGISNGEDIIIKACMKPISTLMKPLDSVNIASKKPAKANTERSDTCVVESAAVVAESALAYALSDCILEKFGSDNLLDIKENYKSYLKRIR